MTDRFSLHGRVAVVTGACGLLGQQHVAALLEVGAAVVLIDVDSEALSRMTDHGDTVLPLMVDITDQAAVDRCRDRILDWRGRIDVLVNNAARNPKVESAGHELSRLEELPDEQWDADLAVGLTGAYRCARSFGGWMANAGAGGVILNIASDLAVIAPDQRLYAIAGRNVDEQPVKPVTYSVVKHGLIGLTRYLATYWADRGVRANALSPGGVQAGQPEPFVLRLCDRIPMGRMAAVDEYRAAVQFLCSDASAYMTGQNVVMDGGRSVW